MWKECFEADFPPDRHLRREHWMNAILHYLLALPFNALPYAADAEFPQSFPFVSCEKAVGDHDLGVFNAGTKEPLAGRNQSGSRIRNVVHQNHLISHCSDKSGMLDPGFRPMFFEVGIGSGGSPAASQITVHRATAPSSGATIVAPMSFSAEAKTGAGDGEIGGIGERRCFDTVNVDRDDGIATRRLSQGARPWWGSAPETPRLELPNRLQQFCSNLLEFRKVK
jgi:hypothetical protein